MMHLPRSDDEPAELGESISLAMQQQQPILPMLHDYLIQIIVLFHRVKLLQIALIFDSLLLVIIIQVLMQTLFI